MPAPRNDARVGPRLFNRIAVLRAERQLSRADLSAALDISYQTVGYLERGEFNPSLELALRLSEFFGVPVEAVFSRMPLAPMSSQLYPKSRGKEDAVRDE